MHERNARWTYPSEPNFEYSLIPENYHTTGYKVRVDNLADELSDMKGHALDILRGIAEDALLATDSSMFFYLMDVWYATERLLRIKGRDN